MSGRDDYPDDYGGASAATVEFTPRTEPLNPMMTVHNVEAEAALLGGLMSRNEAIPLIAERVQAEHFFEPVHARIFSTILKLHERGRQATPVLLRPIFENDPEMKELGGASYLAMLTGHGAAVIGLPDFADQIAELAVRRTLSVRLLEAAEQLSDPTADEGIDEIEGIVGEIEDTAAGLLARSVSLKPRSSASAIKRVIDRQGEIAEKGVAVGFYCRSVPDLDKIIGPAEPGTYNVIGGRPGMCKTTLACSAAWGYAAGGAPSVYLHAEMSDDQMAMRHAADLSHAMNEPVLHRKIRRGELSDRELASLADVQAMADTIPLDFVSTGACDIRRVESAVARLALKWRNKGQKLAIVWLDYIQKYTATDARGRKVTDPTEAAGIVSSTLVRIAERFEVAVFALAQLSRGVDAEKDKRPAMHHLKQSGKIEEDADSVSLLFRPEYYLAKDKPKDPGSKEFDKWQTDMNCVEGQVEIIGEKNRHGPPRTRTVKFIAPQYAIRGGDYLETDSPLLAPGLFDDDADRAADDAAFMGG